MADQNPHPWTIAPPRAAVLASTGTTYWTVTRSRGPALPPELLDFVGPRVVVRAAPAPPLAPVPAPRGEEFDVPVLGGPRIAPAPPRARRRQVARHR